MVSLLTRQVLWAALLTMSLLSCDPCDLAVATESLPDGLVGEAYFFELEEDCGGDIWFLADGTLPPGISFTEDGVLSGTPSRAGDYFLTIGVQDFYGRQVVKGFSLTVGALVASPPP